MIGMTASSLIKDVWQLGTFLWQCSRVYPKVTDSYIASLHIAMVHTVCNIK